MYKSAIFMALIFMSTLLRAQRLQNSDSVREMLNKPATETAHVQLLLEIVNGYLNNLYAKGSIDSADAYLARARECMKKHYLPVFQNSINISTAEIYCLRNPNHDSKKIFSPVIAGCQKNADKINEIAAWNLMANFSGNTDQANAFKIDCYQHALLVSRELNNGHDEGNLLKAIADVYFLQHKYNLAEGELLLILKEPEKVGLENIMFTDDLLAALYTSKAQYDKALFYALKVIQTMKMSRDSAIALTFYGRLTYLYGILGKVPMSLHWANMGLNNAIITNKPTFIYPFLNRVVVALLKEEKAPEALKFIEGIEAKYKPLTTSDNVTLYRLMGSCYYALKQNALAEGYYLKMISSMQKDNTNGVNNAAANTAIGQFYFNTRRYTKAKIYLLLALNDYEKFGGVDFVEQAHLHLFRVDSALDNYQSAIAHLQEGNKLKDSMFNVAKNQQIEELDISYQTAEKEKDLKLVRNRADLEQVQLQHSETTRDWIIAGSVLLLIIAGLLYRQSQLRRKSNELITRKNEVITHKNDLLQSLVEEKEWLLKEVHHRVKNNLHTVICLLESQAAYLQNDALEAIEKSQHRIYTMSLIHQKLYQSDDVKMIDMSVYIPELVKYLSDSFDIGNRIYFNLLIEQVSLNPSQAIPLALLINEALTNSLKYAFPTGRKGEVTISLMDTGEHYKLELADNGIGLPKKEQKTVDSLGMDLMKGLAKEVRGSIDIENNNGVKITVIFEHDALNDIDILAADYFTSQPGEA